MTHPTLLRLSRSCAKWRSGVLLVACLGLSTPTSLDQRPPRAPAARHWQVVAVGDTIIVRLNFTAGARATGARWTIQATQSNGTWTGLPVKAVTASPTSAIMTVSAMPWDSVTFTGFLWGTQGTLLSKDSTIIPILKLRRPPGPPTGPGWDTSATVTGLIVKPDSAMVIAGQTRQLCAFVVFKDGRVGRRTVDQSSCDSIYIRAFAANLRALTVMQQKCTDTSGYCYNPGSGLQSRFLNEMHFARIQ